MFKTKEGKGIQTDSYFGLVRRLECNARKSFKRFENKQTVLVYNEILVAECLQITRERSIIN